MSITETFIRYRRPLGGFAYALHEILYKAKRGKVAEDNLQYFLVYAKRFYEKCKYMEKVEKLKKLLEDWDTISYIKQILLMNKDFSPEIEQTLINSFSHLDFSSPMDLRLKMICLRNPRLYHQYINMLLETKKEELFFDSLSEIWLSIYADNLLSETELMRLINDLKEKEQAEANFATVEYEVDESLDEEKLTLKRNPIQPNIMCLKRVIRIMQGFLQELRLSFVKTTNVSSRINIAKIYAFSLLMVAEKIKRSKETETLLNNAFSIIKKIAQYKLLKVINRVYQTKEINEWVLHYENQIEKLIQELFELSERLVIKIEKSEEAFRKKELEGEEEVKGFIDYKLTRDITEKEKNYLAGLKLKKDDVESYIRSIRTGERISVVEMWCSPFILNEKLIPSITLILGKTGGGKTVSGSNLIRILTKEKYSVVDLSLNLERPAEMVFCAMPMFKQMYKKEFYRLTKVQQMVPEKLNMYILIPYVKSNLLPKKVPACTRVITIPLKSLANKRQALPLILSKMPKEEDSDIIDYLNFILSEIADETWDLDTLKFYLKKQARTKGQTVKITIKEKIGDIEYPRTEEFDKRKIKKLLRMLVPSSSLISSGTAKSAINFNEILKPGMFVTNYLGHITDRTTCFAYITWLAYTLMDYKREHPEKKIGIYINEAQNIVPSQQLVGGVFAHQKYSLAVDIANLCLNWRGMGFKAIICTQSSSQLREQFQTQSHLKILFHTTDKDDIDIALGDVVNKEFKENMKLLVKNRRFLDEHLALFIFGPEIDRIHVVSSAITPFAIERQNVDPFKLYAKMYPQEVRDIKEYIKIIEEDKKRNLKNLIKSNLVDEEEDRELVKALTFLDRGETITTINPEEEVKINVKELEKLQKIPENKVVLDKDKYQDLVLSRIVGENKVVIDKDKLLELEAKYGKDSIKKFFVFQEIKENRKPKVMLSYIKNLLFSLNSFKFTLFSPRGKTKPPKDVISLEKLFEDLMGFSSHSTIWLAFQDLKEEVMIQKLLIVYRYKRMTIYELDVKAREEIEKDLPKELIESFKDFAYRFKDKMPYLDWRY